MNKPRIATLFLLVVLTILNLMIYYYRQPYIVTFPRGSINSYYVGYKPIYNAQYMVITIVDDNLVVELLVGPGPENVIKLEGDEARFFLDGMGLDVRY